MITYIPNQDKNKQFLDIQLKDIAHTADMYDFSYPRLVKYAKTVDVVWFNERKMPCAFFEIEHTTDMKNSFIKYYELQDFNSSFYIIAEERKRQRFNDLLDQSIFVVMKNRIQFRSYEMLAQIHSVAFKQSLTEVL
jgi:hypothetical protein